MEKRSFPERAEMVLICSIFVGIMLVSQRWSVDVYRAGLVVLVVSTLLQIAVGNVPKSFDVIPSLIRIVILLMVVAAVFTLGVVLVPFLARMGR